MSGDPVQSIDSTLDSLEITIDAVNQEASARFWAAALGYKRLYEREPYVALAPLDRVGPRVLIQHVNRHSPGKSPVHLDLRVKDPLGEVRRLTALGANVARVVEEAGTRWTVMTDPEGIPFCVCPSRQSHE